MGIRLEDGKCTTYLTEVKCKVPLTPPHLPQQQAQATATATATTYRCRRCLKSELYYVGTILLELFGRLDNQNLGYLPTATIAT